jgi:DNA-binding beta-propeller fold protein YncE
MLLPAPAVLEFDASGKFLRAWGAPGPGYEWFRSQHGIFVDDRDNVWLSGNAQEDNQILKFTSQGKFLLQIGHAGKNRGSNDTENLGGPAGLFVQRKTNELYVADGYFNHRVIVFDADSGKYKRHWGAYGRKPDDGIKFPPRAELIQGPPPEGFGNPVHAVLVSNDDLVYVGDRTNNRLQVFKTDGMFVKELFISRNTLQAEGTVHAFAVSSDKEQRFLYVMDGSNKAIRVLNRQTMEIVGSIGGHAGHNAREFFHAHGIAADSKGNLFIGEVNNGQRYYKYAFKGMRPAGN